jgi:hypothetical protein
VAYSGLCRHALLEDPVMADNLAKNEINCRNLRYSGLRPRPAAASLAEVKIRIEVVALYESSSTIQVCRK